VKTEEIPQVKVGDVLAFSWGYGAGRYRLEKVTAITPSGIIECGPYQLDPNLRVKGKRERWRSGPFRGEIVTQEIQDSIDRDRIGYFLSNKKFELVPIDVLRQVELLLLEHM